MEKEQAIELLDNLIGMVEDNHNSDYDAALHMAIKALEQEPTPKNDLGVDLISRADARKVIIDHQYSDSFCEEHNIDHSINMGMALIVLSDLPSVTPQESRKGHWTEEFNDLEGEVRFTCSCCGKYQLFGTDFCYNCGAKMVEPQESETDNGTQS